MILLLVGCAHKPLDLPPEVQDADGVGGATAKVEFTKWLGQVILQAVTNITVNVKIQKDSHE